VGPLAKSSPGGGELSRARAECQGVVRGRTSEGGGGDRGGGGEERQLTARDQGCAMRL
jgi:hypothetical protein